MLAGGRRRRRRGTLLSARFDGILYCWCAHTTENRTLLRDTDADADAVAKLVASPIVVVFVFVGGGGGVVSPAFYFCSPQFSSRRAAALINNYKDREYSFSVC